MNKSCTNLLLDVCLRYGNGLGLRNWFKSHYSELKFVLGSNAESTRYFHLSRKSFQSQKDDVTILPSPQEVTLILRKNEFNKELNYGSVKSYDSNQLASNDPIEDTRSEGLCKITPGFVMGVFDGHGGPSCAQVISKRLIQYIAAALLPLDLLKKYIKDSPREDLVEVFNEKVQIVEDLKKQYELTYNLYLNDLVKFKRDKNDVSSSLETAIMKLDSYISQEAIEPFIKTGAVNHKTLSVALSGAVACVSHIDGPHLYVANVGDCNAVLGTVTEDKEWIAKKITKEHNTENISELNRIWSEHPEGERKTVIMRDRLLGELAPLRSFGDYRYKWSSETLNKIAVPVIGPRAIPANYYTPPYLTCKPDLYYHRLTPKDKFLILASDGLWDMLTPLQAVKLVGEHMLGKVFFNTLKLPKKNIQLGDINELLLHRKESLKSKPKDKNAATHLIRHAIGGTEYGVDHSRLAHLLSLSPDVSRMFRDDITVTVVYFDDEFLRQCPA